MNNFNEKHILVIQDSVEMVRQPHADLCEFITTSLDSVFSTQDEYSIKYQSGEQAARTVSNLDASDYDLVIFASNAIIRRETPIYEALSRAQENFQKFLRKGKSAIFLHQGFAGSESKVEFLQFSHADTWSVINAGGELKIDKNHQIMRYPNEISLEHFKKHFETVNFPFAYTQITNYADREDEYYAVISRDGVDGTRGDILASFELNGRLILCPSPLDWAGYTDLFANILTYALFLEPDIVVITHKKGQDCTGHNRTNSNDYMSMVETYLGNNHCLAHLTLGESAHSPRSHYLLTSANLFLCMSPEAYEAALENTQICDALTRGASLILLRPSDDTGANRVEKLELTVGPQLAPGFLSVVDNCLLELLNYKWPSSALIHDLRDVEIALGTTVFNNRSDSISEKWYPAVASRVKEWFNTSDIKSDPCTAVIALWLACRAGETDLASQYINEFTGISDDPRLESNKLVLDALLDYCRQTDSCLITPHSYGMLEQNEPSTLGQAVRYFESIQMFNLIKCRESQLQCNAAAPVPAKLIDCTLQHLHRWDGFLDRGGSNVAAAASIARLLLYPAIATDEGKPSHSNISMIQATSSKLKVEIGRHQTLRSLMQYFMSVKEVQRDEDDSETNAQAANISEDTEKNISTASRHKDVQRLFQRLIASAALADVDAVYPFGGARYIELQAADTKSSKTIEHLNEKNIALRREIYDYQARNATLEKNQKDANKLYYDRSKVQIWMGVSVIWTVMVCIALTCLYLLMRVIFALHSGDAFITELVTAVTVIPVGVGVILWTYRKRYLHPRRWMLDKDSTDN